MLSVTVRVEDALLRSLIATAPARATEVVRTNLERLHREAERRAPQNKHPENAGPHLTLRQGLAAEMTGPLSGHLIERAPHGPFVEENTAAHPIYPVHSHFLHFIGAGGESVFARAVNHPGTRAQPFMGPAADAVRPQFERDVADLLRPGGHL